MFIMNKSVSSDHKLEGEGYCFSSKRKREGETIWCMSLMVGGGCIIFMQSCWGQGVNLEVLCSHSHSSVNII